MTHSARRSHDGSAIRAVSPPQGPGHLGAGPSGGPTGSAGPTSDRLRLDALVARAGRLRRRPDLDPHAIRAEVDRLVLRVHGPALARARVAADLAALVASAGPVDPGLARLHRARARYLTARSRSPRP